MKSQKVLIVMGSDSDFEALRPAWEVLNTLQIPFEVRVASAHRTPDVVHELATGAREAGVAVVIAGAGAAAHLAGVFASLTTLPVVAVPIAGTLAGMDALLSSVQMPPGVPIASVGIGGAKNAGLYAAAILGVADGTVAARLNAYRRDMHGQVRAADEKVRALMTTSKS
jgi:phosphoribosylaminoimidazole carboxylase PurE protein